jgi:hypothetical protein
MVRILNDRRVFRLNRRHLPAGVETAILGPALPFGSAIGMKLGVERQIEVKVRPRG